MAQLLKLNGFIESNNDKDAGLIIVNTCTVKTPTEHKIMRYLFDNKDKKIIIAGCMTATHKEKLKNYPLIGCNNLADIVKIAKGDIKESLHENGGIAELLPMAKNEVIEVLPISKGCLGTCSYCATKFARGKLKSYPIDKIIAQIKNALKSGKKEFWLTAEDTGCYGLDIGSSLSALLKEIINLEGFFKVRLGMINPKYALKYKEELAKILNSEKFFKFIHIPVQSGSDKILKLMNRHYSKYDFIKTVNYFRKNVKNITIATDIIVGFPNESREDFLQTYSLINALKPEVMNISKYWDRPLIESSKMDCKVSLDEKKERAVKLMSLHKKHIKERDNKLTGWALADEKGFARTDNYTKIIAKKRSGDYFKIA
jgi:MiaB-like tRNA modifying enzyme